ncbi:MAG: 30S ribosomal protein S12 methylthiotransferase RimO [Deltaproteobacteria bacterium]|nr:30S ribosomal protein S12 methylthiotransferase RimO [Deltaproteobacteria bacterium]
MPEKVYFISLGCAKNRVDSEVMLGRLEGRGFRLTGEPQEAEVVIVNTCSFIQSAVEESIETILEAARLKKEGACRVLGVAGCLPQRYQGALAGDLPEVDFFIGTDSFWHLPERIEQALAGKAGPVLDLAPNRELWTRPWERTLTTPPGTAFLKIAEGCSNRCAYCTIPDIRGPFRSRDPETILREAEDLGRRGVQELVVVAQDSTAYGRDLPVPYSLSRLIADLAEIEPVRWLRLMYLRPERITLELLETLAGLDKVCPYLDIPIQHVSARVLRAMNRPYRKADLRKLFNRIRRSWPQSALRTTVMVGFPGEGDREFQELLEFVREIEFEHLGVFRYSPEEGTPAAALPGRADRRTSRKRHDRLMALQKEISLKKNRELIGRVEPVLVTGPSSESEWLLEGRTRFQAPEVDGVVYITDGNPVIGEINSVRINEAHAYDLVGAVLS